MKKKQIVYNENKVIAKFKMNLIITQNNNGTRSSFIFATEINDDNGMFRIESKKNREKIKKILRSNISASEQFDILVLFKITNKTKGKFFSKSGSWNFKKMSEITQKKVMEIKNLREFCEDYQIVLDQNNILKGEISLISR